MLGCLDSYQSGYSSTALVGYIVDITFIYLFIIIIIIIIIFLA